MCAKDKMEDKFKLTAPFGLSGDQPQAVEKLVRGFLEKDGTHQTLLGVTGSGKTFTMANVIARLNRPTLVLAHNKTLAAQLYSEFKEFFRKTPLITSSPTTTTTSRKPTYRPPTFISKRMPPSTSA